MSGRRPDTTMCWEFEDHFRETGPGTANGADWQSMPECALHRLLHSDFCHIPERERPLQISRPTAT